MTFCDALDLPQDTITELTALKLFGFLETAAMQTAKHENIPRVTVKSERTVYVRN